MFTEDELEEAGLGWFEEIDYSSISGHKISPGGEYPERKEYTEVVLKDRLRNALYKINPDIPNEAIEDALRNILIPQKPSLIENNRAFHRMITDGIDVSYEREDGSLKGDKVWIFDKVDESNNDWLVTNQFAIKEGEYTRRPDVLVFLNGLPIVVIELKSAIEEKATIEVPPLN